MKTDFSPFLLQKNPRFKKFASRVLLVIAIQWSVVAPSQPILSATYDSLERYYIDLSTPEIDSILTDATMYAPTNETDTDKSNPVPKNELDKDESTPAPEDNLDKTEKSKKTIKNSPKNLVPKKPISRKSTTPSNSTTVAKHTFQADITKGIIGISEAIPLDNPSDNLFVINIEQLSSLQPSDKVVLKYELYGVQDKQAVARSINGRYAIGGYVVKDSQKWTTQVEEIKPTWLYQGRNEILFAAPDGMKHQYTVRNVRIEILQEKSGFQSILNINTPQSLTSKNGLFYVSGFIQGAQNKNISVTAGNTALSVINDQFEGLVPLEELSLSKTITVTALDNGAVIDKRDIAFRNQSIEADVVYNQDTTTSLETISAVNADNRDDFNIAVKASTDAFAKANIYFKKLRTVDFAPLASGMRNVTSKANAYRVYAKKQISQPDSTSLSLSIAFDPNRIPNGYTARDIRTFYFNRQLKEWKILPKDTLDTQNNVLTSFIDPAMTSGGGTDYINGVIQTPETSTTSSFMPTMMSDIKAVNPSANMALISPPSASQRGSANVSYPIRIPAGRQGMQPNVGLQYNDEAGNGWLGMGWSMSMPAISLDTRWGAPVFDATLETEVYSLNGEMLMYPDDHLPHRHTGDTPATYAPSAQDRNAFTNGGVKTFTPRKQGSFSRIERIGTSTTQYYWKVTNANGTISWYGGDQSGLNNNAIIKNDENHIVHWALLKVEDVFGNNMKYTYTNDTLNTTGNLDDGTYLYCNTITYTGHNDGDGNYEIHFENSSVVKRDASINGKLGLKWIDPYLLEKIEVKYQGNLIRYYVLEYNEGRFTKNLLQKVTEFDAEDKEFYNHTFDYYDDIEDVNNGKLYKAGELIQIPDFGPSFANNFGNNVLNKSVINSNENIETGFHAGISAGFEFRIPIISQSKKRTITIGAPFGEQSYKSKGKISLTDITGDGIDDIIFRTSDGLRYLSGSVSLDPNEGELLNIFETEENTINGAFDFYKSKGFSKTVFGQSFDLYALGFNAASKSIKSKSDSDTYMVDGNGDGLMDIARGKTIYFNTIDPISLEPTFTASSHFSENMVLVGGSVGIATDPDPDPDPNPVNEQDALDFDAVRVWVAPREGTITIQDIFGIGEGSYKYTIETANSNFLNGQPFRIAYYEGTNPQSLEIDDYENGAPLGLADQGVSNAGSLVVEAGQKIYFRLHSNNSNPVVIKNEYPIIGYLNSLAFGNEDELGSNPESFSYQRSFTLDSEEGFSFPSQGEANIQLNPITFNSLSDETNFNITQHIFDGDGNETIITLLDETFDAGVNGMVDNTNLIQQPTSLTDSNFSSIIHFKVQSDSNPKHWVSFNWRPSVTFTPQNNNQETTTKIIVPDNDIYRAHNFVEGYWHELSSNNWNNPPSSNPTIQARPKITSGSPSTFDTNDNGEFDFIIKRKQELIGKRKIIIQNGVVSIDDITPITIYNGNPDNSTDEYLVKFSFGFYGKGAAEIDLINKYIEAAVISKSVEVSYNFDSPIASYFTQGIQYYNEEATHLGNLYRGFGQFFYNENYSDSMIPTDAIGGLIDPEIINDPTLNNSTNFGNCPQDENYEDCLFNELNLPDENTTIDQNNIESIIGNIEDWMNTTGFEFPEISFIPARAYVTDNIPLNARYIGLSNLQYSSPINMRTQNYSSPSAGGGGDGANAGNSGPFDGAIVDDDSDGNWEGFDVNTGMLAVNKIQRTSSRSWAAGYSPGIFNWSEIADGDGNGYSRTISDFIDLNGDRYPDPVYPNQYVKSNMTGGLEPGMKDHDFEYPGKSHSQNQSLSLSGTTDDLRSKHKSTSDSGNSNSSSNTGPGSPAARIGLNVNFSGDSTEQTMIADINGDGLLDRVANENNSYVYYLNKGKFNNLESNAESFNFLISSRTEPATLDLNLGIGAGIGDAFENNSEFSDGLTSGIDFSAGISGNQNNTRSTLQDINDDGLMDILITDGNEGKVRYNIGTEFGPITTLEVNGGGENPNLQHNSQNRGISADVQGSLYYGVPICCPPPGIPTFHIKFGATLGGNLSLSIADTKKVFKDFNGDGFTDYVVENGDDLMVYYSAIGRTNKLKTVNNPLGGSFTVDYQAIPKTYDNPNAKWVMHRVTVQDGYDITNDGADEYVTDYRYEGARYDRREREFYGFETVKAIDYTDENLTDVYRTATTTYHNKSYYLNGLALQTLMQEGGDLPAPENLYTQTDYEYTLFGLTADNQKVDLTNILDETYDVGGTEGRGTAIALLTKTTNSVYETTTDPLVTEVTMEYDDLGRVSTYENLGDITSSEDDYTTIIDYHDNIALLNKNLIQIPKSILVEVGANDVRERITEGIDLNTGTVGTIKARINGDDDFAETDMTYDQYGNLESITQPRNLNDERMTYTYTYDSTEHKYIVGTTDSFGYTSSSSFDPEFDTLLETVDLAGNSTTYRYDSFGRTEIIRAPKEIESGQKYTILYEYYPKFDDLPSSVSINQNDFMPLGVTSHFDLKRPTNDIENYTFIDGLARPVQVKKDIRYRNINGTTENMSISGRTTYDHLGRATQSYHPTYEEKDLNTNFKVSNSTVQYFSEVQYDVLDRAIQSVDPAGNIATSAYTVSDNYHQTTSTVEQSDAQNIVSKAFSDARGRQVKTVQVGPDGDLETTYLYSAIDELIGYTDAEGIATTSTYDLLGRKIIQDHPDRGTTQFTYDPAGNLTNLETNKLGISGETISYDYEFNRLTQTTYPETSGQANIANVTLQYGAVNSGNDTGRLIYQQDATGIQRFEYGNMGEIVRNARTIVAPNLPDREFITEFKYDSWNRLMDVTYPDGEKVLYGYNFGGKVFKIIGNVNGSPYAYIRDIRYNHFDQVYYKLMGNQSREYYAYEPALRRLSRYRLRDRNLDWIQDIRYTYDKASNITRVKNSTEPDPVHRLAGRSQHDYSYDVVNRLSTAVGEFQADPTQSTTGSSYTLSMEYNDTHGIATKSQNHTRSVATPWGGTAFLPVTANTYNREYTYEGGTHKLEKIEAPGPWGQNYVRNFSYDTNGNISNVNDTSGLDRDYYWDESNRLRVVDDGQMMQHYIYSAGHERVLKSSSNPTQINENGSPLPGNPITFDNYTTYPSNLIVVKPDGEYTKHYFAGSERILSRIGEEDGTVFDTFTDGGGGDDTRAILKSIKQRQIQDLQRTTMDAGRGTVGFKPLPEPRKETTSKEMRTPQDQKMSAAPGNIYFFHSDHLGTGSFLTDASGHAYQFFANLPFGETMIEQHSGTEDYENRWKFNGKELDTETGLYYYGARYYDPSVSIWMSVDPLAEKFPAWNPYNYTMQNPIRYIDPDGKEPMDDYFNSKGILIYSDGDRNGTNIRIVSDNIIKSSAGLSDSDKTKLFKSNSTILSKYRWKNGSIDAMAAHTAIANHYKSELLFKEFSVTGSSTVISDLSIGMKMTAESNYPITMFTTFKDKNSLVSDTPSFVTVGLGSSGRSSNPLLDDYYNYMSTIQHERVHYFDDILSYENGMYRSLDVRSREGILRHIEVYNFQQSHFIYDKTTKEYKRATQESKEHYENLIKN